jgi:hypothetical protein
MAPQPSIAIIGAEVTVYEQAGRSARVGAGTATPADLPRAFRRFQATRAARTAQMQDISHRNAWMDTETEAD